MTTNLVPTMVLFNGRILTLDDRHSVFESLAIYEDKIVAIGSNTELENLRASADHTTDLGGRTVLPGFTDAHIHLQEYAYRTEKIDCNTSTLDECLARITQAAEQTPPGTWILGHGWNQNRWPRFGSRDDLDSITTKHPVYLTAISLHAGWVNSQALKLADIHRGTDNPTGGSIQRDDKGEPTGILFEKALELITTVLIKPDLADIAAHIDRCQADLWQLGLTGVHDFDHLDSYPALQNLQQNNRLGIRVVKNLHATSLDQALALGLRSGAGNDLLRIGGVKLFADGALGPQTAAMLEAYSSAPHERGITVEDRHSMDQCGRRAAMGGFPLIIHAIGDRANREALDAFEAVRRFEAENQLPLLRHRIEHVQLIHPDDAPRLAALGIVASMQPTHATSDMAIADRHWGDRVSHAFAWKTLLNYGTTLAFGSDAPVEDPNPLLGLHAATTRKLPGTPPSQEAWVPEQRINLLQALKAYTEGPAYAANMDDRLGQLAPGYYADLIVLGQDLLAIDLEAIPQIQPQATMVAGTWRYRAF